jgi:hypothetical protein
MHLYRGPEFYLLLSLSLLEPRSVKKDVSSAATQRKISAQPRQSNVAVQSALTTRIQW